MKNYKEEEKKLIERSISVTRIEFESDLDPEDDDDIIKAVLMHKNKYSMGADSQKIATEIFRKNGLWQNGKITLEAHDQEILQKKLEQTIKYNELRTEQVVRLKELQKAIDMKISAIELKPIEIAKDLNERKKKVQEKAYAKLDEISISLEEQYNQTITSIELQFEQKKKSIFEELKLNMNEIKRIERISIDGVIAEFEELAKIKMEYVGMDIKFESEAEVIETKIDRIDASLFNLTVKELKEIANSKNLVYSPRILKAELVEMIQGE